MTNEVSPHCEEPSATQSYGAGIFTVLFVFGATAPSGPGPPHLRGF